MTRATLQLAILCASTVSTLQAVGSTGVF